MERLARIELANKPWQGFRLPLHHSRIKMLVENTRGFWFTRVQLAYPGFTGPPHLSSKHGAPLLPNPESPRL